MSARWRRGGRRAAAALVALAAAAASAQGPVATPFYTPQHFMQGLHREALAPAATAFATEAAALTAALRTACAGPTSNALAAPRAAWQRSVAAWERLSAVAVGPLVERRSQRQIDFVPTRPALIERAIARAPRGAQAMELVGTPGKGLPALEWLLWTQPLQPATPACAYAVEAAAEVEREAAALKGAFAAAAADDWAPEAASAAMAEALNQWIGGIERLRWPQMEKPLRADGEAGLRELPRAASGGSAASWAVQWQALRRLAVADAAAPAPGAGLVTIEFYLRGRGLNPQADALRAAVAEVDRRMAALSPTAAPSVLAAAGALTALKRLAEGELATALGVAIGFSDADGD